MNILITGGSGFIGSHIVERLISNEHEVRVLDIKPPHILGIDFVEGSILDSSLVKKAMSGIDVVYHLAGVSNIDLVKDSPLQTIEFNVLGTAYMLEEARHQDVKRFILASSVYVYEKGGHLYTFSKLASEMLCENYFNLYNLPYTILRLATAYGPRNREADVISIFINNAVNDRGICVKGSGEQVRNFIYVEDLAEGSVVALDKKCENQVLTLAGKESTSIRELAIIVQNMFSSKIDITFDNKNTRQQDHHGSINGLQETFEILNWKPRIGIKVGLKKYINWYKSISHKMDNKVHNL